MKISGFQGKFNRFTIGIHTVIQWPQPESRKSKIWASVNSEDGGVAATLRGERRGYKLSEGCLKKCSIGFLWFGAEFFFCQM